MDRIANISCPESVGATPSQLATPSFSAPNPSTPGNRNPTCDIIGRAVKEHNKDMEHDQTDLEQYVNELHVGNSDLQDSFSTKISVLMSPEKAVIENAQSPSKFRTPNGTALPKKSISPNKDEKKAELPKSVVEVTDSVGKSQEDYLREIEELNFEMGMMQSFNKKLQQELNVLKCEKKSPKESVAELKSPFVVTSSATQTYICATTMDDASWDNMVTKFGQVDCVDALKEEVLVLLMKLEQKEKDIKSLTDEMSNLQNQMQDVVSQKAAITNQFKMLQKHLEKFAENVENIVLDKYRSSDSLIGAFTPNILEEEFNDTLELSLCLSGNLTVFEQSCISHNDSIVFTSTFHEGIDRISSPPRTQMHPIDTIPFEEEQHEFATGEGGPAVVPKKKQTKKMPG